MQRLSLKRPLLFLMIVYDMYAVFVVCLQYLYKEECIYSGATLVHSLYAPTWV